MKEIKMKALECKLVPIEKITANNWNPNKVAKPEMDLLQKSIEDNGFCFPIATIYDKEKENYNKFCRCRCDTFEYRSYNNFG